MPEYLITDGTRRTVVTAKTPRGAIRDYLACRRQTIIVAKLTPIEAYIASEEGVPLLGREQPKPAMAGLMAAIAGALGGQVAASMTSSSKEEEPTPEPADDESDDEVLYVTPSKQGVAIPETNDYIGVEEDQNARDNS